MENNSTIVKSNSKGNTEVSELHDVCEKLSSLVVSLFNVEQQKFVFCSQSVRQVLGYRPDAVVGSGWEFWYSLLKPTERPVVQHKLSNIILSESQKSGRKRIALEYQIKTTDGDWTCVKHEIFHKRFSGQWTVLNFIYDNSERALIDRYLESPQQASVESAICRPSIEVSDREKQVLKLIACGLSSRQIAKKLYISRHTVISHRKNLIKKFKVKNTAELIKEASKVISL